MFARVDYLVLVHNTYGESCKVIILVRHKTRVLGCLAADKGAACLNAALCHTGNDLCDLFGIVLSAGYIVKEKLWLCTAADDIVNAHGNAVDTDSIVLVQQKCDLYLCANAVCTRNENRFFDACDVKLKQSAEPADAVKNALCHRPCNILFHKLHSLISCGNVNSCVFIAV